MEKVEPAIVTTGAEIHPDLEKTATRRSHLDAIAPELMASEADAELLGKFSIPPAPEKQLTRYQLNLVTRKSSVVTSDGSKSSGSRSVLSAYSLPLHPLSLSPFLPVRQEWCGDGLRLLCLFSLLESQWQI